VSDVLDVEVRRRNGTTVIEVAGEADLATASQLRDALAQAYEADEADVVVDLSRVTMLDSTALATLLNALRRMRRSRRELRVAAASPAATRVLRLARLEDDFGCYPTVRDALARRR
jgi:anti-sigma B factor antagonist